MQVQTVSNTNFEAKNTFLKRAKNARNGQEEKYWKSLHYEAKARLNYSKFNRAETQLGNIADTGSIVGAIAIAATLLTITYRKLQSVIYDTKSYSEFPNRFSEPDNFKSRESRYYNIKKGFNI